VVQVPKFVKISSDFIPVYEKIAGCWSSAPDPIVNIAGIQQGSGKMVMESTGNFCNQESGNPV